MSTNPLPQKYLWSDLSLWILLLTNFITIFIALREGWNVTPLLWIYWSQSIIIGLFNFIRILQLKEFSTKDVKIFGRFVDPTFQTKIRTALIFLFSYGVFNLFSFIAIRDYAPGTISNPDLTFVYSASLLFFFNHLFSYLYNRPRDTKKQNIGTLMFYPFARIIPMYLIFVFVPIFSIVGALPIFLLLKTSADAVMHIVEHQIIRKGEV